MSRAARRPKPHPAQESAPQEGSPPGQILPLREPVQPSMPLREDARARHPTPPLVVDDVVVCRDHTQQQGVEGRGRTGYASASERRLARWLTNHIGFVGAVAFVRRYGADEILDTLHEGLLVERFERAIPSHDELNAWREAGEPRPPPWQNKGTWSWHPDPKWRNPAGMLRHLVRERAGENG